MASADGVSGGGYVLAEASGDQPRVILVATGSEVPIALEARAILEGEGTATRVVPVLCLEWFQDQDEEYRDHVLPTDIHARVSVEAGSALGCYASRAAAARR